MEKVKAFSEALFKGTADTILYNGKIITVDKDFTIAQAVAIRDDKFVAVGSNDEVKALADSDTQMIDLNGQTVTPGLIDSHCHPIGVGKNLLCPVQMSHVENIADVLEAIARRVREVAPGEWISTASNWRNFDFDRLPAATELDSVAPDNPVWVQAGGHRGIANSMALKLAGITKDTVAPPGGIIFKDQQAGEPTGRLDETAQKLVTDLLPQVDLVDSLKRACAYYNSIGVTGIQNDGVDPDELEAYLKVKGFDELTLRAILLEWFNPAQSREEILGQIHAIAGAGLGELGDDNLKLVGIKTINETLLPGDPLWPRDFLRDVLLEAAKYNLRVSIHSNARANEENLHIYQEVNEHYPVKHLRWGIVHQRFTTPELIKINKDLGLVVNQDLGFGLITLRTLDRKRRDLAPHMLYCPIPLYLKAGIPVSLNTDGGAVSTELSIWTAVWAATQRGRWPDMGGEYSISREDALRLATMGGAHRMMMEGKIGSIEPGKLADLAVLPVDPLTCRDDQLKDISVLMTMLGGRIVYRR